MNDEDKTKEQLVGEVIGLRGHIEELERQEQRQSTAGRPRQETGEQEICRTVLNATEDAVFFMDTQGKVVFVNETLARWLHTPKERLLNTNIFDAIPEPWRTSRKAHADKAVLTGEAQRFEDEREGRWFEHRVSRSRGRIILFPTSPCTRSTSRNDDGWKISHWLSETSP